MVESKKMKHSLKSIQYEFSDTNHLDIDTMLYDVIIHDIFVIVTSLQGNAKAKNESRTVKVP